MGYLWGRADHVEGMIDQPGVGRGPRRAERPALLNVSRSGSERDVCQIENHQTRVAVL